MQRHVIGLLCSKLAEPALGILRRTRQTCEPDALLQSGYIHFRFGNAGLECEQCLFRLSVRQLQADDFGEERRLLSRWCVADVIAQQLRRSARGALGLSNTGQAHSQCLSLTGV